MKIIIEGSPKEVNRFIRGLQSEKEEKMVSLNLDWAGIMGTGSREGILEEYKEMTADKGLTINQIREEHGLDPLDNEEANKLLVKSDTTASQERR